MQFIKSISLTVLTMLLLYHPASAFNHDQCMATLEEAPYNLESEDAIVVCDAKQAESGDSNTAQSNRGFQATSGRISNESFHNAASSYLQEGRLVVQTCVGHCPGSYPICPSGYNFITNTASRFHHGAYHGRYAIRSGICMR